MAELEIHHETHDHDPAARIVGIMAAVISVFLAIVTIMSHRAHTEGVLLKTDANDKWSQYQASRIKFHNLELGEDILNSLPSKTPEAEKIYARYEKNKDRYSEEGKDIQKEALSLEEKT